MKKRFCIYFLLFGLAISLIACGTTSGRALTFSPGTYEATVQGYMGPITVRVAVSRNRIESVEVVDHIETKAMGTIPVELIPNRIVEAQSLAVDVITGATVTSFAILAAAENALSQAGANIARLRARDPRPALAQGQDETFDVVIVGAGLAGIMAAYELRQSNPNLSYVIVEKVDILLGALPAAGGAITGLTSRLHRAGNAESTIDEVYAVMQRAVSEGMGANINRQLLANVFGHSEIAINRLIDWGIQFNPVPAMVYTNRVHALWGVGGGPQFAQSFLEHLAASPVNVRTGSRVTELVVRNGEVTGVRVQDREKEYQINARAVLLATGGFSANRDLMERFNPQYTHGVMRAHSNATGDGFRFTEQFGTRVLGTGIMGTLRVNRWTFPLPSMFYVSADGTRVFDESAPTFAMVRAAAAAGTNTFALLDSTFADRDLLRAHLDAGFVREYASLEALAAGEGINRDNLLATVMAYNAAVDAGVSPGFGLPADRAIRLDTPPFFVQRLIPTWFGTIPGIEIDENMRVLDGNGRPVPNLFAAGELTFGNITNNRYPGIGIGVGYAVFSGTHAGSVLASMLR